MYVSRSVMSHSLRTHGLHPVRPLCPWGVSRQEFWSGLLFLSPRDLPDPGIEPWIHTASRFFTDLATRETNIGNDPQKGSLFLSPRFPQNGSAPRSYTGLPHPVNDPEVQWVEHYSPHCVHILISQVSKYFQNLVALIDIKSEGTQRTLRKK